MGLAPPATTGDPRQITDWLRLFIEPGQVTELRSLNVTENGRWPRTRAGFFDYQHLDQMAEAALDLERNAVGVYFVPNPVDPALLARCCNRVTVADQGLLTSDGDIL